VLVDTRTFVAVPCDKAAPPTVGVARQACVPPWGYTGRPRGLIRKTSSVSVLHTTRPTGTQEAVLRHDRAVGWAAPAPSARPSLPSFLVALPQEPYAYRHQYNSRPSGRLTTEC